MYVGQRRGRARRPRGDPGLTLIEALVVVAVIGVLAWAIVPRVVGELNLARFTAAYSLANDLFNTMERYYTLVGGYFADAGSGRSRQARWGIAALWESRAAAAGIELTYLEFRQRLQNHLSLSADLDGRVIKNFKYERLAINDYLITYQAMDRDSTRFEISPDGPGFYLPDGGFCGPPGKGGLPPGHGGCNPGKKR